MYITHRKNMVAQYIEMRTISDLCEEVKQSMGMQVSNRWWYQEGINLERERAAASMAEDTEEEEGAAGEGLEGWVGGIT